MLQVGCESFDRRKSKRTKRNENQVEENDKVDVVNRDDKVNGEVQKDVDGDTNRDHTVLYICVHLQY